MSWFCSGCGHAAHKGGIGGISFCPSFGCVCRWEEAPPHADAHALAARIRELENRPSLPGDLAERVIALEEVSAREGLAHMNDELKAEDVRIHERISAIRNLISGSLGTLTDRVATLEKASAAGSSKHHVKLVGDGPFKDSGPMHCYFATAAEREAFIRGMDYKQFGWKRVDE